MLDNRDWCDVDSDDDFCIPDLPPLPLVKSTFHVEDHGTVKEEQSPRLASVVSPVNPGRFRFDFSKESSPKSKGDKAVGFVCFVGKFPNRTTLTDIKSFVKSKGINFTEIRMGPKKKPNANTFGYVDLPSRKDYEKLLALDGTQYQGRAIRVDHATRKETSSKASRMKKYQPRREVYTPTSIIAPRQSKPYVRRGHGLKKSDIHTKKTSARFQRFKTLRSQKTGTRNKQKYRKVNRRHEQKSSAPKNKRFVEDFCRN